MNKKSKFNTQCILLCLTLLAAIGVQAGVIVVSWDSNAPTDQVTSYRVFCATNSAGTGSIFGHIGTVTTNSYSTNFADGSRYFFKVRAVNMTGEGSDSMIVGTPPLPAAPTGLTVITITQ